MLRLAGGTHFVVLRRSAGSLQHSVHIKRRFDDAVAGWQLGDRVSPIFPIENAPIPQLQDGAASWVLLFGPCDPGCLGVLPESSFLTLGLFNLLVFSESEHDRQKARALAEARCVHWEEWSLEGSTITSSSWGGPAPDGQPAAIPTGRIPDQPSALHAALREYRVLVGTTVARAQRFSPELSREMAAFDTVLRGTLAEERVPMVSRLGTLVTVNAALSRLSSQCFSGTSPVFETESHYWTHSLFGIGIPCLAIGRLRRFAELALGRARFGDRLAQLRHQSPNPVPLWNLPSRHPFWATDILFRKDNQPGPTRTDPPLPLITFFSGRDGNHSSNFSLSVPLEVVSSCNATAWTLRTVTHELSHTVVDLVLARLLPKSSDLLEIDRTVAILAERTAPLDLFEQLRANLCHSLVLMDRRVTEETSITRTVLSDRIRLRTSHLNELLTHIFDFLYFYRKDPKPYIRSLWASWAVIPNIRSRVPEYIVRSLCALMANNLTREDALDVTCEQLATQLAAVQEEFPEAAYIGDALAELRGDAAASLRESLQQRIPIVRFVRHVLYSPEPDRSLTDDPLAGTARDDRYNLTVAEFDERPVTSPLAFVEAFSNDAEGSETKSAWMLQKLAFSAWDESP